MKRLKLAAFKAKNIDQKRLQEVDQLLGQVLGDCHDGHVKNKYKGASNKVDTDVNI
ncbi:MAG: hypothetical protein ACRBFS_06620 [Aureispira sp.]